MDDKTLSYLDKEAVDLLLPKSDKDHQRCRLEISWILMWYKRQVDPDPPYKKGSPAQARKDIEELQKRLNRVLSLLDRFDPIANVVLFSNERDFPPGAGQRLELHDLLQEITAACDQAKDDVRSKDGGRPKDFATEKLVRHCLRLFEKRRPGEVKSGKDDFQTFVDIVYKAVSGKDGVPERVINKVFRESK